jgi:outer membrane biosynthesis protein TonB
VFPPGDYVVGSDPGCELVLADHVVDGTQAYLSFRDGKITLQDAAASGVGVTVNGERQAVAEVRTLDDVAIGPFLLKFRIVGQKRPAPSRPAAATASSAATAPVVPAARPAPAPVHAPVDDEPDVTIRATVPEIVIAQIAVPPPPAPAPKPAPRVPGFAHPGPSHAAPPAPKPAPPAPAPTPAPLPPTAPGRKAVAPASPTSTVHYGSQPDVPAVVVAQVSEVSPAPAFGTSGVKAPSHAAPAQETHGGAHGSSVLDAPKKGRKPFRLAPFRFKDLGSRREDMAEAASAPEGTEPKGPNLRVRVFWGKSAVGVFGFPFGQAVSAGPAEDRDVPLYRIDLPKADYALALCEKGGWVIRVPKALRAFKFESSGWKPADGPSDGEAHKVALEPGKLLRIGDAAYSVEMRVDRTKQAPKGSFKDLYKSGALLPFALVGILGIGTTLAAVFMPKFSKESSDFTPQQMLRAAKAVLKPPEKKKEEKKPEKKEDKPKEKEKPSDKKVEVPPDVPRTKNVQQVNRAIKSVEKVTSGLAVESLLKATSKLAGGPKGYGDKGMGYKLSPLIGKPPVAMAGMGFGPGMGGFGTETKGIGAIRGMGGGGGGGIGTFAAGGTGKGKVGGTVVSAPSSGFKQRGGGGTLARELIAKVINEHLGEVRGCYERALLREAGLAGKLNLEWTIDTTGHVEEIKVKQSTIKGADVPNCIVNSLKTWIFPKPTGGKVIVSYPFLFNSVGF